MPVFLGTLGAGLAARRGSQESSWLLLIAAGLLGAIGVGLRNRSPSLIQGYALPFVALYLPALLLSGLLITFLADERWGLKQLLPLAVALAVFNILLSQVAYAWGCMGGLWECL